PPCPVALSPPRLSAVSPCRPLAPSLPRPVALLPPRLLTPSSRRPPLGALSQPLRQRPPVRQLQRLKCCRGGRAFGDDLLPVRAVERARQRIGQRQRGAAFEQRPVARDHEELD